MSETKVNATLFSKFKKTQVRRSEKLPDLTGLTLGEFHADSRLDIVSGEADIYLCSGIGSLSEKKFLLKYYRRENAVKPDVLEKLRTVTSPFVAPVAGYGEYEGHQYAARPYYEMSTLAELLSDGVRFSEEELRTFIIPSVIEGLKAVHDASILHKDLKPANLIPDDAGEHIVLIDFGISSHAGKNTFVVTETGMTPCYAAPEALQGIFHKETDYYALGITVFELFTGFTPFQNPDLSQDDVARLAAVSKIEFPEDFPKDLKKLVQGLTYKDISHRNELDNPNRRWGYNEVRRWLQGEDVPVPGESEDAVRPRKFLPYSFGGVKHQTLESLVKAMLKDPASGIREIGRGILTHHMDLFAPKLEKICREAEERLQKNSDAVSAHQVFYRLMYRLAPELITIFCGGQEFGSLKELSEAAISNAISGNAGFLSSLRLLQRSFLDFYGEDVLKSAAASDLLRKANEQISLQERTDVQAAWILGYALSEKRNLRIGDRDFGDLAEILEYLRKVESELGFSGYFIYLEEYRKELEFFAAVHPDDKSGQALKELLEDLYNTVVFGPGEYHFKNAKEFDAYVEELRRGNKTGLLSYIFNTYDAALLEVSVKVWQSDSYEKLRKIVSGFVCLEDYIIPFPMYFKTWMEKFRKGPDYSEYVEKYGEVNDEEFETIISKCCKSSRADYCRPDNDKQKDITLKGIKYPTADNMRVKLGQYVKFGSYHQNIGCCKEPIEWLVLDVCGNEALLLSRYALDCIPYHYEDEDITWENSGIREWLNDDFLKEAFSEEEQRRIKLSEVANDDNPKYGTSGGNNTQDHVFCLSIAETEQYFLDESERLCKPTEHARSNYALGDDRDNENCWWRLRSPGDRQRCASFVKSDGTVATWGYDVDFDYIAFRPAIRIIRCL